LASTISQIPSVRNFLLEFQRGLCHENICVMEGRDIGTVVFPHAFCKIFISASPEVRAQRRFDQLKIQGREVTESYDQILADVIERDRKDSQRKVAPLKVAEGAIEVDTSDMEKEDVLQYLIEIACNKAREYHLEL